MDAEAEGRRERELAVDTSSTERSQTRLRLVAGAVLVLVAISLGANFGNSIFNVIIDAREYLQNQPLSLLGYFAIFSVMSMFLVPYSPFCIAIGFIFGITTGLGIEMVNIFLSSSVIYVFSRHLIKKRVEVMIERSEGSIAHTLWKGVIAYIGRDWREAAKMNVLLCFIPMPYGMNRYLFSLTDVPFSQYTVFFMVGMVPNTLLNLLVGAALSEASGEAGVDTFRLLATLLACCGILLAIWHAKSIAQQVLVEAKAREDSLGENTEPCGELEDIASTSEVVETVITAEGEVVVAVTTGLADDGRQELGGRMEEAPAPAALAQGGEGLLLPPTDEGGESATGAEGGESANVSAAQGREEDAEDEEPVESAQSESDQVSLLRR